MTTQRSKNEDIKLASCHLRGSIEAGLLRVTTGAIDDDDAQLTKFHGTYLQDDRDLRRERRKRKLEPAYSFMVRVRVPGGVCTPPQWLAMDAIASEHANGTLRLTSRQALQFHGVLKSNLKRTMQAINTVLLDTLAACGDVNRNVMCHPNPDLSPAHAATLDLARQISTHLTPRTRAYSEIWLDGEKLGGVDEEPIYGRQYLPRKFKIAVALPPTNDVDVYSQDLGLIAITDAAGDVVGYNVTVGGGMGATHGDAETFPRTADLLGFCVPERAVEVAEKVVAVQRDFGDRNNRKRARLKYTIADRGLAWFRDELEQRLGYELAEPGPFCFETTGDRFGWARDSRGDWHYTLFVENGRVVDSPRRRLKSGLRSIAQTHRGDFRLTPNQNLIIARVSAEQKVSIEAILRAHGLMGAFSGLRRNSLACVALPTCGQALAEAERCLPSLVTDLERVLNRVGLLDDDVVIRMTGCPNGCVRPYLAEIGLVGRSLGCYDLYLGASFDGAQLAELYRSDLTREQILEALAPLLERYAAERHGGEHFGEFVRRNGIVALEQTKARDRKHVANPPGTP